MTAPNGPILFNSSTGSDSLASGLGPSTAVNSTTEGTTASYSGTTITFSGATDLSGVSAGHLLYLVTSTGRRHFIIASVNDGADTLTVDDTPTGTASGLSWAIGGKRATLDNADSRLVLQSTNGKSDWVVQIEEVGSAYTIAGGLTIGVAMTLQGDTGHVEIEQQNNDYTIGLQSGTDVIPLLRRLKITNSNGTKTNADGVFKSGGINGGFSIDDCIIGDATKTLTNGIEMNSSGGNRGLKVERCEILECLGVGIFNSGHRVSIINSRIHDNASHGLNHFTGTGNWNIVSSVIHDNGGDGLNFTMAGHLAVYNSIIHNNTGDGFDLTVTDFSAVGNIISENGGYGILGGSDTNLYKFGLNHNAFYNNTSGEMNNLSNGPNDITLTADPFVDAASGDFNINNDAGGGADLRAATVTMS